MKVQALHLSALCVAVMALAGCRAANKSAEEKTPPAPVKWEAIRQLFLEEWTELVGTTTPLPDRAARVTSPVEGRVESVLSATPGRPLIEGQIVQAGDVIAQLDASLVRANRDKAVASKKTAQAEKEAATIGVKLAQLEVNRLTELRRQQLGSAIELEKANVALEAAQASIRADDSKLESADKEIAALDRQVQLHTLAAPRTGRLGRLQVVVGQTLAVGTVVADILDVDAQIDVLCFVPFSDGRKLHTGQTVRVGSIGKPMAGESQPTVNGEIVYIANQAESETGLLAVKARLPNRELQLKANTVVRLRVLTSPGRSCWAVPESALLEDQDPPSVVVVEEIETKTNGEKEEQLGKARRLRAVLGVRDRMLGQVEVLRFEDPEKKWHGDLEHCMVVMEKGLGVQTGDAVKLEEEED
ncbi:MAG: efflux RND transporter periplasmic adaptor subunit [Gemmataceae bacterium]